jgi:esterase/lipase
MDDKEIAVVVKQARRVLLNPQGAVNSLSMGEVVTLMYKMAQALCAQDAVAVAAATKPETPEIVDRLDTTPKPVTVSSH